MRISLNLATRPFADIGPAMKRLRIAMGVLLVVSLGLVLGLRTSTSELKRRARGRIRWTARLPRSRTSGTVTEH